MLRLGLAATFRGRVTDDAVLPPSPLKNATVGDPKRAAKFPDWELT